MNIMNFKLILVLEHGAVSLTQQETACYKYLLKKQSKDSIMRGLGISHDTLETLLDNIKRKTGYANLGQLLKTHQNENLTHFYSV